MSNRNYNVFFNIHTVSGIIISVVLYIIFFAGAFALFREEISLWETGKHSQNIARKDIDFDTILSQISKKHHLTSRDIHFNLTNNDDDIYVLINPAKDTLNVPSAAKGFTYFAVNIHSGETSTYQERYSLGEFLYYLHFLEQLPFLGVYLSGFVSLFFLFAIVTGVIVHWKKIVSNFYSFNPKNALKRVWTEAHTALGIIGLPFQFIYAVTGTYFCLSILMLIPANFLYKGDQNKLAEDMQPERKTYEWIAKSSKERPSINTFVKNATNQWNHFYPKSLYLKNYQGTNAKYLLVGELRDKDQFLSTGRISLNVTSGITEVHRDPYDVNYIEDIQQSVERLHFANFGGISIKLLYFVLSLITCFVIITGVLIWIEARNKKNIPIKQRLYTTKVGHIYLAICLSLYPVTAASFLAVKLLPAFYPVHKKSIIYLLFFGLWLIATIYFRFKRNNYFTNKVTLLFGSILGLLIPVANGLVSNNWVWNTYKNDQFEILIIDILWICLSITGLSCYFKIKPKVKLQSAFAKNPIEYHKK